MTTPEDEDGEFEVDTLSGPKPVKLSQERCDVLTPTFPVDQSGGGDRAFRRRPRCRFRCLSSVHTPNVEVYGPPFAVVSSCSRITVSDCCIVYRMHEHTSENILEKSDKIL